MKKDAYNLKYCLALLSIVGTLIISTNLGHYAIKPLRPQEIMAETHPAENNQASKNSYLIIAVLPILVWESELYKQEYTQANCNNSNKDLFQNMTVVSEPYEDKGLIKHLLEDAKANESHLYVRSLMSK